MSKISLKPNASGTGVFSLEAPNSNVDRTLNLPDEAGTLATVENLPAGYTDSDALDLFNATGSAPVYACRAWVNFDGTGTVSIRDSGNVSSITDDSTGVYLVNFTTAMPDSNYSTCSASTDIISTGDKSFHIHDASQIQGNSQVRYDVRFVDIDDNSMFQADTDRCHLAVFR